MARQTKRALGDGLDALLGRAEGPAEVSEDALSASEGLMDQPEARESDPMWDLESRTSEPTTSEEMRAPEVGPSSIQVPTPTETPNPTAGSTHAPSSAPFLAPPATPARTEIPPAAPAPENESAPAPAFETESTGEPPPIVDIEDMELLQLFIQECHEHLETIEGKVLSLEAAKDPAIINEIFRCMHTMKGNASFLGLQDVKELSHRLESVLDRLRNGTLEPEPGIVDMLLNGSDGLSEMLGALATSAASALEKNGGRMDQPVQIEQPRLRDRAILGRIERVLTGAPATQPVRPSFAPSARPARKADENELVTDEIVRKYVAEASDLLDDAERVLLELERGPADSSRVDEVFRLIHTIKGNSGFMGQREAESACMQTESLLEELRSGRRAPSSVFISTLLRSVDRIRLAVTGRSADARAAATGEVPPLGEILVAMGETTQDDVEHALDLQDRRVGEILVAEGKLTSTAVERALEAQKERGEPGGEGAAAAQRKDIRVDTVKLDKLFDLMGELITAEAMVLQNPQIKQLSLEGLGKAGSYLSKITREMQEITMTIRMIPLEGLFGKMRRVVRDLSKKFGKSIELRTSGQETEMDRNVIEEISDPLIHLIRNAIDHGIESDAERKTLGKPSTGTVSLSARYEGNEIWITVGDDGAGLNRQKILAKAQERGMLSVDPESMADVEVWQFIFEPGFSTAERVSEISGRGVGMDVVRRNLDKLRGKITVSSVQGQGCQIVLKIPLTLAIIDGISIRVGHTQYALPLADMLEFKKATAADITSAGSGHEVIRLREQIIPVIKLAEYFGAADGTRDVAEGILLVAQRSGARAALLADEIVGYQQIVVKTLPDYMSGIRAISGCSIMGNGDVSLIIDTGALIQSELEL